jgi:hypothetical protein
MSLCLYLNLYLYLYFNQNQYQNLYLYQYQLSPKRKVGSTGTRAVLDVRKMDKFGAAFTLLAPMSVSLTFQLQRPWGLYGPREGPKTDWVVLPWCPGEAGGGGY